MSDHSHHVLCMFDLLHTTFFCFLVFFFLSSWWEGREWEPFLLLFFLLYLHGLGNECSLYLAEVGPEKCVRACVISFLFYFFAVYFACGVFCSSLFPSFPLPCPPPSPLS